MTPLRFGLCLVWALAGGFGCTVGAPERASDIQNLNAITDDIAAVRMTDSDSRRAKDPNERSTIPRTYEIHETP